MRKLNGDEINDLQEGSDTIYFVRLYRMGRSDWELEKEGNTTLYIQRRTVVGKHNKMKYGPRTCAVLPIAAIAAKAFPDWAEYYSEQIEDNGDCVAEDYKMEVYKL